jgi:hypothetical protein
MPSNSGDLAMRWYHYVAYFLGGAFLANTVPHFVNGVSGNAFQSPFASPPGQGLSSSTINVLWGLFNLAVAYLLICRVDSFNLRKTTHVLTLGTGVLLMSLMLARAFGRWLGLRVDTIPLGLHRLLSDFLLLQLFLIDGRTKRALLDSLDLNGFSPGPQHWFQIWFVPAK